MRVGRNADPRQSLPDTPARGGASDPSTDAPSSSIEGHTSSWRRRLPTGVSGLRSNRSVRCRIHGKSPVREVEMVLWRGKPSLRSLRCFYCNQASKVQTSARLRDWKCGLCDAINILDENGRIADTIPAEYQRSADTTPAPDFERKPNTLSTPFCSVCTSNQALLVKTLASYLPEDDDPDVGHPR